MILGKLIGTTGIRNLSQNYLSNKYSIDKLKEKIYNHRNKYYSRINQNLIIESYSGWYGCIPAINDLYTNSKLVIIIRDPRTWVQSNMDWGTMYGKRDWVVKLGLNRLNPKLINDLNYVNKWDTFNRFQKLCWSWNAIYSIIFNSILTTNSKTFRFEDIFFDFNKFNNLISFICKFENHKFEKKLISNNILKNKVHQNISYDFPHWKKWNKWHARELENICGDLMKKFNYGSEQEWLNLCQ